MSLLRTFYIFTAIWLVLLIHNQSNYGNCYDLHCLAAAFWGVTLRSVILTAVVYFCAANLSSQRRKRDERYHSDEDSDGCPDDESLGCVNETNTASLNTDTPGVNSLSESSRKQPTGSDNNHLRNVTTLFDENLCWNCSKENFRSALESCGKCGSLKCHECSACSRICIETCDQIDMSTLHKKRVKNHLSKQPSVILSVRKMRMCADEISLIFRKEDQLRVFDEELGWGKVTAVEARFHGEALYHIEYDAETTEVGGSAFVKYISMAKVLASEAGKYFALFGEVQALHEKSRLASLERAEQKYSAPSAVRKTDCYRCDGSGFLPQYSHVMGGVCFNCNGQ